MARHLHGRHAAILQRQKDAQGTNAKGTLTATRERPLPQTGEVSLRCRRSGIPRTHCETRHPGHGPRKAQRNRRLARTILCQRGAVVLRIRQFLPAIHSQLFGTHTAPTRAHQEGQAMGMDVSGTRRIQQTQSQIHLVTSSPYARQEQTILDRIRRIEIRHRCDTPTGRL